MFLREEPDRISPDAVLSALENEHDRQILAMAQKDPIEAQQVIETTGMPKSTAYRRIHQLEDAGLLILVTGGVRDGHRIDRFSSAVEVAELRVASGRVEIRWALDEDPLLRRTELTPQRE